MFKLKNIYIYISFLTLDFITLLPPPDNIITILTKTQAKNNIACYLKESTENQIVVMGRFSRVSKRK